MIIKSGKRGVVYHVLQGTALTTLILAALLGGADKVKTENLPDWMSTLFLSIQHSLWWAIPVCAVITGVTGATTKFMGKPWIWKAINEQIDNYRDALFEGKSADPNHYHRVTLFRVCHRARRLTWVRICLHSDPYLIPVARSGHTFQKSNSHFRIKRKERKAEGVAGAAYVRRASYRAEQLPEVEKLRGGMTEIEEYASGTNVGSEWVRKRLKTLRPTGKPIARSMLGIPVDVGGEPWGVLVIDSTDPNGIEPDAESKYELFATSLTTMLKRV